MSLKNYDLRKIHCKRCYRLKEISLLMGVTERTVQIWHKNGLSAIDEKSIPYLVLGETLKTFLKEMMERRRTPLQPDESYCVVCHKAVKGVTGTFHDEHTKQSLGPNTKQVILHAECEFCGSMINKYSSERIEEMRKKKHVNDKIINEDNEAEQEIEGEQILFPYLRKVEPIQ
jgi:hypothetical protein